MGPQPTSRIALFLIFNFGFHFSLFPSITSLNPQRTRRVSLRPTLRLNRLILVFTTTTIQNESVLSAVGIDAEEERLQKLLAELEGKDLQELISEGTQKLASVPSGGAGAAAAAPAAGGAAAAEAPAEEKKEEAAEESDEDMGFGLFD
ncbi:hypothetical protein CBS63078_3322 [Aspergillus niger]|nr:hypothetical protein CBS115989_1228 [Aspergillus niger]KAI2829742.1 hypothetical protein CBS133816_4171 [Aspergillus niger]KAI2839095.1 hypothetical protein CBS11350_7799 [Aspergillus niger]KAI2858660.1 hypothetical protein CBS11232_2426 [Aspergillus niger]KAI2866281.1 hypothetical protein CBS12448_1389 [Aspergillus niger]